MGRRRLAWLVAGCTLVAGVVSASAGAATSAGRPPGSPDLAALALAVSDLPSGARVDRERYYRDPSFVASYEREFSLAGARVGRSSLLSVLNELDVEPTAADAATTFAGLRALLRTKAFRTLLAREVARGAGTSVGSVAVGRPRTVRIGDGAVSLAIRIKAEGLAFQAVLTFLRVDRVLGIVALIGFPQRKVFPADADRLARVSADRIGVGLMPVVKSPPVIAGILNPGQILSIMPGTWAGDQLAFSYQWERCIEIGGGCTPIADATAETYTIVNGDLASTMRVTVVGRNGVGFAMATSTTTRFVTGPPGAPVVATETPNFDGVVGPGATFTATTGTWTGNPTSFAYQWRRCSPTTSACVDIPDATAPTYTLTPADSGSFIRLLVVATNAAGSGGAHSPPSAPAP